MKGIKKKVKEVKFI